MKIQVKEENQVDHGSRSRLYRVRVEKEVGRTQEWEYIGLVTSPGLLGDQWNAYYPDEVVRPSVVAQDAQSAIKSLIMRYLWIAASIMIEVPDSLTEYFLVKRSPWLRKMN